MRMEESMKDFGSTIDVMAKVMRGIVMEILMKVLLKEVRLMVMAFINGLMERFMMGSGLMDRSKDKALGKVIYNFFNNLIDTYGESYIGEWKDNKANGKGEHIWNTGDKYIGDWFEFLKHGHGTDYFANGDIYTGEYRYGKPCGMGKYTWVTGAVYEGEF